ncbi:outer membrane beta-barrel protein [Novosphingobium soli]
MGIVGSTVICSPSAAQTIDAHWGEPDDVPGRGVIPEYTAPGFELAGFDVFPSVVIAGQADSNVFSRTTVQKSDLILIGEPQIRLRRKDASRDYQVDAGLRRSEYLAHSEQSATEYRLAASHTYQVSRSSSLAGSLGYRREAIQRGTVENDLVGGEPLMRRVTHASFMATKRFNRFRMEVRGAFVRQRFEDVGSGTEPSSIATDQSFRNVSRYGAQGVIDYDIGGRTSLFSALQYDCLDYAHSPALLNRDATNWSITGGFRSKLTPLLYAQLGLGYRRYAFQHAALDAIDGIAISGDLQYYPSRLLAVRAHLDQTNTTSPYDFVGAVTLTTGRLELEYEMRRSISWLAAAKFTVEDYGDRDYSGRRLELGGGPRFRVNRWLTLEANVNYARRWVHGPAPFEPFSRVYGGISVTLAR